MIILVKLFTTSFFIISYNYFKINLSCSVYFAKNFVELLHLTKLLNSIFHIFYNHAIVLIENRFYSSQ